jgi:hypothetical protein
MDVIPGWALMDDSLQIEILLTRFEAQRLADVLPACGERLEMHNTILACALMLKSLKSGTVAVERIREVRRAYEGWKRSTHRRATGGPIATHFGPYSLGG